ncbi:MAG: hypothetical protein ACREQL_12130, partial [Candidatus Binatia bacterium]
MTDAREVAAALGLPFAQTIPVLPAPGLLALLPMQYARRHLVLPLVEHARALDVAVADPYALAPLEDLRFVYRRPVRPLVVPAGAVREAIDRAYDGAARDEDSAAAALR